MSRRGFAAPVLLENLSCFACIRLVVCRRLTAGLLGVLAACWLGTGGLLAEDWAALWPDRSAMRYCVNAAAPDETCLQNALTDNSVVLMPRGRYDFARPVVAVGLRNVVIQGEGRETLLSGEGTIFECIDCSNVVLANLRVQSPARPTIVTPGDLPTADGGEMILVDRWGAGHGYMPTVNDVDIFGKLSAEQKREHFDAAVVFVRGRAVRVTAVFGYLFSILCFDCSHSRFDHNEITGGKNFAGGIVLWRGSAVTGGTHFDLIDHNSVRYTAYSGIFAGGGDHVSIVGNTVEYAGESGIKTGRAPIEQLADAVITGNSVSHCFYDGLDLSSQDPHSGAFLTGSIAIGNTSRFNGAAGVTSDGAGWTIAENTASDNGGPGMLLDVVESVVEFNRVVDNNRDRNALSDQLIAGNSVPPGGDWLVGNEVEDEDGAPGYALYVGGPGAIVIGNLVLGSGLWAVGRSVLEGNRARSGFVP